MLLFGLEMKKYLFPTLILLYSQTLQAGLVQLFKDEDGKTNWQYVANWSSGILIILLSIAVVSLFFTWRRARKSNLALKAIRNELEQRVKERTSTLNESNRLLKEEVAQHVITTNLLRASESYIKNILTSMPLMLIGLDAEGHITQWNKRAEDVSGTKTEDALGKNLWKAYPIITVSPDQVNQAIEKNEITTIKHSQRGQYQFDITIYPLQEQEEPGVVILIDDVTEKVLAENMLIQRDKMSSMGELAATMAQDIKPPLQAILDDVQAYRNLLQTGELTVTGKKGEDEVARLSGLLEDAFLQGQHVSSIISNLLAFARGRSDEKQLASVPEIMDHALELAGEMLSVPTKLRFKDITIERNYEQDLPKIPCYVFELQQVFLSLFRHALGQFQMDRQQPVISIRIMECYDAIWIKVQHNGVGLTSEEQQYIFEPFFSNQLSEEDYDVGKRLSFSHFIIAEHHHGEMAVTSDINVGTTFHMQIPINKAGQTITQIGAESQ